MTLAMLSNEPALSSIELDPVRFRVRFGETDSQELTSLEFRILALFEKNSFSPMRKEVIQEAVWGSAATSAKTLNVHFTYLRRKLRPIGLTIGNAKSGFFQVMTV